MEEDIMNQEKQQAHYEWAILIILFFSQMILSMGAYAWGPLGPYLKESLMLTPMQIGSLTSTIYLSSVICSIPAGISVDRWGVRLNLFICMMLMGIAMIVASFINNYLGLIILLVFAGASYGMINPLASKGLAVWFDIRLRATAFGIRQMGVTAGGAVAGLLLIYLAQLKNWNFAVLVVGLLALVAGFLGVIFYKEPPDESIPESASKKISPQQMGLIDLIKNRNLLLICLIMSFLALGQSSIAAFLVLYLKEHLGFPAITAGFFLTVAMISGGAGRVFWGMVSDKIFNGRRLPVMKIVCVIATISALAACFWAPHLSSSLFILIVVFLGLSFLGFQGVASVLLVEVCGHALAGRATGLGVTIAWMGMVLGPVIYGAIVSLGYSFAWLFVSISSFVSILLCQAIHESYISDRS